MSSSIPKAVLYYSPHSIWSAAVLLALEEKGYAADELDRKQVDLSSGDNFDPAFLRLNPRATVPTLVVPIQKTLAGDIESRYKALTETETIINFLDKSRCAVSRTHTTSTAPAPSLASATIAFSIKSKNIIDYLHSDGANPNHLRYVNARNNEALRHLATEVLPTLTRKRQVLAKYISDAEHDTIHVSEKTKAFWREKQAGVEVLLDVVKDAHRADDELEEDERGKREAFYTDARRSWEVTLKEVLVRVSDEIVGPFTLGDQLSVADLHLASWLARVVKLSGGVYEDDGETALGKVERYIGGGFGLAKEYEGQRKLGAFWDEMGKRESWKRVYGEGVY